MAIKTDPFTRTPGVAGKAYIDNGIADEIIQNFCSDNSEKYVYKITGLRGSGKSVEYSRVIRSLKEKNDWLVYTLSSSGDGVDTLIAKMAKESFIDTSRKTTSIKSATSLAGNAVIVSGGETLSITRSTAENEHIYSSEAVLSEMIDKAAKNNYKVLIGIDDISKTKEMSALLSIIGSMLLEGLPVYLIVTGLSENIDDFSSEKNLSFFRRADSREIKALNKYDISYMYEKLLNVDSAEAKELESLSMGYAYAYQVLGSLYFNKKHDQKLTDIIPDFERIMFKDSYDLIWNSLSNGEKEIIRSIYKTNTGKAEEIQAFMKNPKNYPVYRNRLINKHVVDGDTRGYLKIHLPLFDKYIEIWGDE